MAITSDFSIFANTDFSTTPFQYLIFAGKAPLLHVELNELQYLGFMRDRVIMKALGNKCIGSITRDSNTKKTAIKGDFIIDGYAIANLDTSINTEIGDSIYFKVTLEEVTKDSELTKNGVVNGEAIENTIMDKARGFETSRRSAISVEITTVESQEAIKVASISDAGEVVFSIDTANTQEDFDAIKASIENLISSVEAERNRAMGVESGLNSGLAQIGQGLSQLSAQEGQHYTEVKNDLSNLKDGTTPVAKATEATTASNAEKVNGHTVGADVPSNAVFTDTVYDDSTVKASIQNIVNGTTQVGSATKATQDAQGNVIDTTYAKKTEIPQGTVVDDALSLTSTNPVQNKVVKAEFDKVKNDLSNLKDGTTSVAKAVADEDGNNIKSTYATKQDIRKITLTTASGNAALYKLGKMRHLVLNDATFSSTTRVLNSTDAPVGSLYFRAEVLFNIGDDLEGGSATLEDICISDTSMWNATRSATGASPVAVTGATGSVTWMVHWKVE